MTNTSGNHKLKQLLEALQEKSPRADLEELIADSRSELELSFSELEPGEKLHITQLSLGLMEVRSDSKSFHRARMSLLATVLEKEGLRGMLELDMDGPGVSTHILHSVEISSLEVRLFLESKLAELETARLSPGEAREKQPDDAEIDILTSSFRVLDSVLDQLNVDENVDFLESCDKIAGAQVVELLDSLKGAARDCVEFVLDVEELIRDEFEMSPSRGVLEPRESASPKAASSLYWIIYYCCSLSSKWQINEPDQDLGKFVRLLEAASRYLNPLHFACVFPTMIHLSVVDWANAPGVLEALLTSLLSFCSLIKEGHGDGAHSGLYFASLLVTSAWWSPGIDAYRTAASKAKTGSTRSLEYLSRNYINLDHLDHLHEEETPVSSRLKAEDKPRTGTNMPEFAPLDTNTIPEFSPEDSPGPDRVRRISLIVFKLIKEANPRETQQLLQGPLDRISFTDALNDPLSPSFEKTSAFVQTLVCILTLLTCRTQHSLVPPELWTLIFKLIIVMTPKSGKGYYFDSPRKVALFISLLRSTAIAFSAGYPSQARQFALLLENLKIEASFRIPKLILRDNCEEFSEQDQQVVDFFRSLLDID